MLLLGLICAWSAAGTALAADTADTSPDSRINDLENRIEDLKEHQDIDTEKRRSAAQTYKKAIAELKEAREDDRKTQKLRQQSRKAPDRITAIQKQLSKDSEAKSRRQFSNLSLDELMDRLDELHSRLSEARSRLTDTRDALAQIAQRPGEIRQSITQAQDELRSLKSDSAARIGKDGDIRSQAQQALDDAQRLALGKRIDRLQQELSGHDEREQLQENKRAQAQAEVANLEARLARLETALTHQQLSSSRLLKSQSEKSLKRVAQTDGLAPRVAEHNIKLTQRLGKLAHKTAKFRQLQSRQRRHFHNLEKRFELVKRQLEIGGASVAMGEVLRKQRRYLNQSGLESRASYKPPSRSDISAVELDRFQLQQERTQLNNPAARADALANKMDIELDAEQKATVVKLLKQRRRILDRLIDGQERYAKIGRELRALSQQFDETLATFRELLDKRLFWLPSFPILDLGWPMDVVGHAPWLFKPDYWQQAGSALVNGIKRQPLAAGLGLVVIGSLAWARRFFRRKLRRLGHPVGDVSHDTVWVTLHATLLTLLLSLPSILIFFLLSFMIRQAASPGDFALAFAEALQRLGLLWAFVEPFANICRTGGLAPCHFQWPANAWHGLHRNLRRLLVALFPAVLIIGLTEWMDEDSKRQTLGLATFLYSEVIICLFAWRLLHPRHGVLADVMEQRGKTWRLGYGWLPLGTGAPIIFGCLAIGGYYYTALQLQSRFFYSVSLMGGAVFVYSLIIRWVTVVERRLALARARRKREEAREKRATREAAEAAGDGSPDTLDEVEIDLVQINEQTRGLVKIVVSLLIAAGLWFIWSETLPALEILDNIHLWQYTTHIDGKTQSTDVTLGALLLALSIGGITALAGRNLPGFLEITILQRFSMNAGSRYAMATLFQYAIVTIGLLSAARLVGLNWSSIRWLIAALGVGLGFGLQEIFANFVSGLIILFERPVRVGDTVTVGELTGTVSRIKTRASTVTDWDNREVVIPNKTFITATVVNWTLSNDITRLVLRFSVALDSDGDQVEKLINEAIQDEPNVLPNPPPSVFMVGYDDNSALHYEARVFYHDLYNMLPLQHALYRRVHAAFAEHGIRIVYPQQDLHLRSVDASVGQSLGWPGRPNDDK